MQASDKLFVLYPVFPVSDCVQHHYSFALSCHVGLMYRFLPVLAEIPTRITHGMNVVGIQNH